MQVIPISNSQRWDEEVSKHSGATIFHSAAWAKVIEEAYGHRSNLYVGADGSALPIAEIKSLITGKRGHCIPFADRCAILGGGKKAFPEVVHIAKDKAWKYLEVRGKNGIPENAPPSSQFVSHSISLGSAAAEHFSSSTRRAIRKAEGSGLVVKIALSNDFDGIEQYYQLHIQTRRRHGLPPQPVRFFRAIQRHIISEGLGFIVIVEDGASSQVIASAIFFEFGGTAFYKFGASDTSAWSLRPNNLLFSHAIAYLSERNQSSQLDLGRSDLPDVELHRFKRGWGAEEFPLKYFSYRPLDESWIAGSPPEVSGDKIYNHLFRALPSTVNRLAGSLLYPHIS